MDECKPLPLHRRPQPLELVRRGGKQALEHHGVAAQVGFESSMSHLSLNTLSSRRFQLGYDRVKLHRPTMGLASLNPGSATVSLSLA